MADIVSSAFESTTSTTKEPTMPKCEYQQMTDMSESGKFDYCFTIEQGSIVPKAFGDGEDEKKNEKECWEQFLERIDTNCKQ